VSINEKLLSGKFWLTIITGLVFAYAVVSKILGAEATASIIAMVFISYFQRNKDQQNGGGKPNV
jgi:hypothetical protein